MTSLRVRRSANRWSLAAAVAAVGSAAPAAGDPAGAPMAPRSVGRAGATAVAGDGGAALLVNPGGLARRRIARASAEIQIVDRDLTYRAPEPADAPAIADRGAPTLSPLVAAVAGVGPVVAGIAALESAREHSALPAPGFDHPQAGVTRLYPHRYGGLSLRRSRRTVAVGASWRATSWLAIGAAATASDVQLEETRAVWAGDASQAAAGDPTHDLRLSLAGRDRFVPGASAGILAAPAGAPIELAASVRASAPAELAGHAALARTRDQPFPEPRTDRPRSRLTLASPLVVRGGARYLGDRVLAEIDGELVAHPGAPAAPSWSLSGVRADDGSGRTGELQTVAAAPAQKPRAAVRASADVEVVRGFAWVTGGYAYETAGAPRSRFRPTFAAPAAHTLAIGAETSWSGITVTVGYARSFEGQVTVQDGAAALEGPFGTGPSGVADGRYDGGSDHVGAAVDVAWQ